MATCCSLPLCGGLEKAIRKRMWSSARLECRGECGWVCGRVLLIVDEDGIMRRLYSAALMYTLGFRSNELE